MDMLYIFSDLSRCIDAGRQHFGHWGGYLHIKLKCQTAALLQDKAAYPLESHECQRAPCDAVSAEDCLNRGPLVT